MNKNEGCPHPKEKRVTIIIESCCTCEVTVLACGICSEHLEEPKTEY